MDSYFLERRQPFFVVLILLMLSYSVEERFLVGHANLTADVLRFGNISVFLVALLVEHRWVQIGALAATGVLIFFTLGWTFSLSELAQPNG